MIHTFPDLQEPVGMTHLLSPEDWATLSETCLEIRSIPRGKVISARGDMLNESILILGGMIGRYIPAGEGAGQLVAVEVPGDFADLHAFPLKQLDHNVTALTDVRAAIFPHADLSDLIARHPGLARQLWALTLVDASIHRHWAFRNGAKRSFARLADLLCELDTRLQFAGTKPGPRGLAIPLTQIDLANACGMSAVHINRVLRDLREDGCCTYAGGYLDIHDRRRLYQIAQFDPGYLYLPEQRA